MAKVEYTRWRLVLMQVMMWLVLAGAVGLAALVNMQAERRHRVALSEPFPANGLTYRLPEGWRLAPADDPRVVARVVEPDRERAVSLVVDDSEASDPFEYLVFSGLLSPAYTTAQYAQSDRQPLHFAGAEGVLVAGARVTGPRQEPTIIKEVMACAILPSGEAVTIFLLGSGPYDARDVALVRLLAGEIAVR
jgi:hypothetical protein